MRPYHAIIIAGALVATSAGGSIIVINRYEVTQPLNPITFNRSDLRTGRVEACSSIYDNKTYCASDLVQIAQEALDAAHLAANKRFLSLGYSQEDIDHWPTSLLEAARNLVGNGGSNERLKELLSECTPNGQNSDALPWCRFTAYNQQSLRP